MEHVGVWSIFSSGSPGLPAVAVRALCSRRGAGPAGLTHRQRWARCEGSSGGRSGAAEWDLDSNKGKQYLSCRQGLMSKQDLIKDKASNLNFSGCLLIPFFASSPSHRRTQGNDKIPELGGTGAVTVWMGFILKALLFMPFLS